MNDYFPKQPEILNGKCQKRNCTIRVFALGLCKAHWKSQFMKDKGRF